MENNNAEGRSLLVGKGSVVEAKYIAPELPKFADNPCILALPSINTRGQAIDSMLRLPRYSRNPRKLPPQLRTHAVMDLLHFFQPLPIHLKLEGMVSRMLRDGYLARNPLDPTYRGSLKERLECFKSGKSLQDQFEPTASGFFIAGMSGVGKSTGVKRALSLYPQVVLHSRFQRRNFMAVQIVWLRLECPKDGSVTALCTDFFEAVDDLLGTKYSKRYGAKGRNTEELMLFMAIVAAEHNIGALIVDEVQDLSTAKSGGAAQVMNFFVKLINMIGIPVILVGTYKAIPIMCSEFRLARRGSGQGDVVWDRMSFDEDWHLFSEAMWDLQYLKKKCPLTTELSLTLHEVSYGVTDLAIRIYLASQIRAIETGLEEISEGLIRSAYRDDFRLVNRILDVLKSGNISPLHNLQDIFPPAIEPIHQVSNRDENGKGSENNTPAAEADTKSPSNKSAAKPQKKLPHIGKSTINGKDNIGLATSTTSKSPKKNRTPAVYEEDDLRGVVARGKSAEPPCSAYDALLQKGFIQSSMEYV